MGNPRKPLELRQLHGTAKDHPGRQNRDAPGPNGGIGPAPVYLSAYEAAIWDELVGQMHARVMGQADRLAFELAVRITAEMRLGFGDMPTPRLALLSSLLSRFGMTPVDRTKLIVPKSEKSENPFGSL